MLTLMKGVGPVTQNALLDSCSCINNCFEACYDDLVSLYTAKLIGKKKISSFIEQRQDMDIRNRAEEILEVSRTLGIDVVTREDVAFPVRFKNISDIPVVLYMKGSLMINEYESSAGIVGARRCTKEGKGKAIELATSAVSHGSAVISGMAKGIDSYAHTAAIKSGGYTIAVLGNGVDICYPKEHDRLYEEIARCGCVLSEYPPGTMPREYNFPRRNRLIAALSDTLYVVDAGRHSGTETTIESSRRYGRQVIVV
ncbi:DNA-processing protein DprA [Butyrivibrio sp. WCD3002]|uniref:DNA-processing protein DprA n=1 Tax=Butyrivibrio sp. WCD3002 TaxID=1280676 RepID=UPI001A98D6B0